MKSTIRPAGVKAWTALVVVGMIILGAGRLEAQGGPISAQVQAALRAFLAIAHTWTGTQTFTDITINGSCTGCGGGGSGSPGGATNTSQYNAGSGNFGGVALNATATNKFLRQVSSGAPSYQQPASGDLSDTANIPLINAANVFSSASGQSMKKLLLPGSSSGTETVVAPATGGGTLTLPGGTIDFSASGGAGQFVKQNSAGGAFTVVAVAESEVTFTDITTGNASTTKHGYVPKLPNDATKFYDGTGAFSVPGGGGSPGGATNTVQYNGGSSTFAGIALNTTATAKFVKQVSSGAPTIEQIADADLAFTDITTNNATSSAHGYMKKLSGNAYDFVLGDGSMGRNLAGGTITTAQPWTLTQTWNAVGTVFNMLDLSVTRTASADVSSYFKIRNGAGELFSVHQDNNNAADAVCLELDNYNFGSSKNIAMFVGAGRVLNIGANCTSAGASVGAQTFQTASIVMTAASGGFVRFASDASMQFSNTSGDPNATKDTGIARNAAGTVEFNNGTAGTLRDSIARHGRAGGTAPTAGSCATSPGTPSGADEAGRIAVGTSPSNTCVVNFGTAYANAPICQATNETRTGGLIQCVATTTAMTFTQVGLTTGIAQNFTAADSIAWSTKGY